MFAKKKNLKLRNSNDCIRSYPNYNNMKVTRRTFEQSLENCRQSKERIRNENLVNFLLNQEMSNHCKSVRFRCGNSSADVSSFDGVIGTIVSLKFLRRNLAVLMVLLQSPLSLSLRTV